MNNWFDKLVGWVLTAMALCKDTSENILELCQETNNNPFCMQQEVAIKAADLETAFAEVIQIIQSMGTVETQQMLLIHQQTASNPITCQLNHLIQQNIEFSKKKERKTKA